MRFLHRHEVTPKDIVSEVLDELVYHEDKTSHPISKLSKINDFFAGSLASLGMQMQMWKYGGTP